MRRHAALLIATLALASPLVACVPEPTVEPTPSASATVPATVSPVPSAQVIAPSERPPTVFGGDCEAMLPLEEVGAAIGTSASPMPADPGRDTSLEANSGGLSCMWEGAVGERFIYLTVTAFPLAGVEGVDVLDVASEWTERDCSWYCAVADVDEQLAVVTTVNDVGTDHGQASARDEVARIGDLLASRVSARYAALGAEPWTRDRNGWVDVPDCTALSAAASASLGFAVEGEAWTIYIDPPLHGGVVADAASRMWSCALRTESGEMVELWGYAGTAWRVGSSPQTDGPTAATGLPVGWTGFVGTHPSTGGEPNTTFSVTDGVNELRVAVPPSFGGADGDDVVAAAIAAFEAQL